MKLFAENTIKIFFCKCPCGLAIKKDWCWDIPTPAFMPLQYPVGGGMDNGRGNFLSFADQYGPGTIIKLFL